MYGVGKNSSILTFNSGPCAGYLISRFPVVMFQRLPTLALVQDCYSVTQTANAIFTLPVFLYV